jgi:hypothetical protein
VISPVLFFFKIVFIYSSPHPLPLYVNSMIVFSISTKKILLGFDMNLGENWPLYFVVFFNQ